jgi:hypothetical protein
MDEEGTMRGEHFEPLVEVRPDWTGTSYDREEYLMEVLEKQEIDCIDVMNLLGEYADGDLTPTLHLRLDEHMNGCSYCGRMRAGYLQTIRAARDLGDLPVPVETQNRLRQALNRVLGISLSPVKARGR